MSLIYVVMNRHTYELEKAFRSFSKAYDMVASDSKNLCYDQVMLDEEQTENNSNTKLKSITEVNKKVYDPLHFNDIMPYGKYKGQTVGTIIQSDPDYLVWCQNNVNLLLDEDCCGLLEASLEK